MARLADPERRTEILNAARSVFQARGYTEARMSEIAERAGIAAGTLYLYFPSKEALAQALGDDYLTRLTETILPHLAKPDTAEAIARSVHAALAYSVQEQDLLRFIQFSLGPGNLCEHSPADAELHRLLAENLQARMAQGQLVRYDPQVLAELVSGLIQWVAERITTGGVEELARYEKTLIQMLQYALLPPRARTAAQKGKQKSTSRRKIATSSCVAAGRLR